MSPDVTGALQGAKRHGEGETNSEKLGLFIRKQVPFITLFLEDNIILDKLKYSVIIKVYE